MTSAHSTTRREFVQATATVAGSLATGGQVFASQQTVSRSSGKILETEVLVCGGGCAGVAAALTASRRGAKVLLIEKAPFAGGIITSVGLPYFDGIADIRDKRIVVRGLPLELLARTGVCSADAKHVTRHNPTIPNTFEFKLILDRLLRDQQEHLSVLFNSFACGTETSQGRITKVQVANKDGLIAIHPQVVVDCTGDADVAAWSGAPTEQTTEVQPLTLHFRIGHVKKSDNISRQCLKALVKAQKQGELPLYYGPGVKFMYADDEIYVHGVRVPANPTDAADLTRAEMQGRSDAWAMFQAWKRDIPEFENAYFIEAYPWIGVRESRRLVGQHVLSETDIMQGNRFDDAIATGCWYLDLHPNKTTIGSANDFQAEKVQPAPYDIPYRSLLPQQIENLLVAGRCLSATRQAQASARVTATAMALGEAAGTAAALAVITRKNPQEISGVAVRQKLAEFGGGPFTDTPPTQ